MSKRAKLISEQVTTEGRVTVRDYEMGIDRFQVSVYAGGKSWFYYRETEEEALKCAHVVLQEIGGTPVPQAGE